MTWKSWPTIRSLEAFRTAKYKQRRVLNSTGWIEDPNLQVGACTALSLEWLKAHHANPSMSASKRIASFKAGADKTKLSWLAGVFNAVGTTYPERIKMVARAFLGRANLGDQIDGPDTAGLTAYLDANRDYGMLMMKLTPAITNHICAYFQDATALTFFDPNSGEYRVNNGDRRAMIAALRAQYLTYLYSSGLRAPQTIEFWVIARVSPL